MPADLVKCRDRAAPAVREHPGAMADQHLGRVVDMDDATSLRLDLPHGYQTIIDAADWLLVQGLALHRDASNGYVYFSIWRDGKNRWQTLHGLLMYGLLVRSPKGMHVDHRNGDPLDNRRANLRVVTPQRNQVNRKRLNRNNTSGVRGVAYQPARSSSRPWRAHIKVDGRIRTLGQFATKAEALAARRAAELRYFGEQCP